MTVSIMKAIFKKGKILLFEIQRGELFEDKNCRVFEY